MRGLDRNQRLHRHRMQYLQETILPQMSLNLPLGRLRQQATVILPRHLTLSPMQQMQEHNRKILRLHPYDLPLRVPILLPVWSQVETHAHLPESITRANSTGNGWMLLLRGASMHVWWLDGGMLWGVLWGVLGMVWG